MAGKVALGIIFFALVCAASYYAGWQRREDQKIECRIVRIVTEENADFPNVHDLPVPYTIAGRGFEIETHVIPGVLGQVGDTVTIHK